MPVRVPARALQHALQTKAVFGGLDLLRVLPADGGEIVGIADRALQEIHLAVELQLTHGEQVPRQHQQRQDLGRKQTLVSQIVNGEDARRLRESRVFAIERLQQNRNQRRLPVMAMRTGPACPGSWWPPARRGRTARNARRCRGSRPAAFRTRHRGRRTAGSR